MEFLLVAGMLVCGWVFLCVLSGERERRETELDAEQHRLEQAAREKEESDLRALLRAGAAAAAGGQGEKLTRVGRTTKVE
jgi:hypothetical protein